MKSNITYENIIDRALFSNLRDGAMFTLSDCLMRKISRNHALELSNMHPRTVNRHTVVTLTERQNMKWDIPNVTMKSSAVPFDALPVGTSFIASEFATIPFIKVDQDLYLDILNMKCILNFANSINELKDVHVVETEAIEISFY